MQPGQHALGLAHVQAFFHDALGNQLLILLVRQSENDLGVADRKPPVADELLNRRWQFQQPQCVRHHGAALADLAGDFLLGQLELPGELRVTVGFLEGVEIFALEIFDERQFQHRVVVRLSDDDRHFRQLQQLRRAPAAFARDQFKTTAALAHDERLDDALFADGIGQFAERFFGKVLARLERAGPEPGQRHALDMLARIGRGNRNWGWGRGLNARRRGGGSQNRTAAQQRAEAASQSRFRHARRVSNQVQSLKPNILSPNRGSALVPAPSLPARSADYSVCCVAGFQTRWLCDFQGLPIGKSVIQPFWKPALR